MDNGIWDTEQTWYVQAGTEEESQGERLYSAGWVGANTQSRWQSPIDVHKIPDPPGVVQTYTDIF